MIKRIISLNIFTFLCMLLLSVVYPLAVSGVALLVPGGGKGRTVSFNGKIVGFLNEGQEFTGNEFFHGRPSAVSYNGAGSGGSNKGPSNPEYLREVEARIDTFLVLHPYLRRSEVPAEMVTASGSGLDPHISPPSAFVQARRVAEARGMTEAEVHRLIAGNTEPPLAGLFGPPTVNVLTLNVALENYKINNDK
jgi:potassium-transporting ATPase KdpC subunit